MKVLIIEDENHSAEHLQCYIRTLHPDYEISGITKNVVQNTDFLQREQPDLIFSDIRLQDGLSFDIFRRIEIASPIIFATAHDRYIIQAFKFNSVDYLPKPIDSDESEAAVQKATERMSRSSPITVTSKLEQLLEYLNGAVPTPHYRGGFLMSCRDEYITIEAQNVYFVHSQQNITRLYLADDTSTAIPHTLGQLEKEISPAPFLRVNCQHTIQVRHIKRVGSWFSYKLEVRMNGYPQEEILINRKKAATLKEWLDK